MSSLRTEITEIVTGLALLGYRELDHALGVRPRLVSHVTEDHFDRLDEARAGGKFNLEFETAWENGLTFAQAHDGLRGRVPWQVEWKGPHKPPGYEQIPADLRIDHVYLISCKYGSNILHNVSPSHLFDRKLAEKRVDRSDWFGEVASEEFQDLYDQSKALVGLGSLPARVEDLEPEHRTELKNALPKGGSWPDELVEPYRWFVNTVSQQSAERWKAQLGTKAAREEMLWRLLRLQASPYFVLGASTDGDPLRYRVGTPWDFRDRFDIRKFDVWGDSVGQPLVRWRAEVLDTIDDSVRNVDGHVEVRWSHGRFGGAPEAKVHLTTPHHEVAGYYPIV